MPWIDLRKLPKTACYRIRITRRIRHSLANQRFFIYGPRIRVHEPRYRHLQLDRRLSEEGGQPQATEDQCPLQKGRAYVRAGGLESTNLLGVAVLGEPLVECL